MTDASPTHQRILAPIGLGLLLPLVGMGYIGCKKDEPPPPLPSAAPAETAAAPLELEPEDAGKDVDDGGKDAGKKKIGRGTGKPGGLAACCAALAQNAANAPPPNNLYLGQAAAYCQSLNSQGKDKASAAGILGGMLKGAGLPGACR